MSSCIKELNDYNLIKKCSKCGNISLKSNFHKDKNGKDGLISHVNFVYFENKKYMILRTERKF